MMVRIDILVSEGLIEDGIITKGDITRAAQDFVNAVEAEQVVKKAAAKRNVHLNNVSMVQVGDHNTQVVHWRS